MDSLGGWTSVSNVIVSNGFMRLVDDEETGSAIRRSAVNSAIQTAYAAIAVALPDGGDILVYLSRNGRHFTSAGQLTDGVWTVSTFKEADGTADYYDSTYAADATFKTYGVRLVLVGVDSIELTGWMVEILTNDFGISAGPVMVGMPYQEVNYPRGIETATGTEQPLAVIGVLVASDGAGGTSLVSIHDAEDFVAPPLVNQGDVGILEFREAPADDNTGYEYWSMTLLGNDFGITTSQAALIGGGSTGEFDVLGVTAHTVGTPYQLTASDGQGGTETVYLYPVNGDDGTFIARAY